VSRRRGCALLSLIAVVAMAAVTTSASAAGVPYTKGDIFAGVGQGIIKHFSSTGVLLDTLDTGSGSFQDTGMCFDASGSLYSTNFEANDMSKFDTAGNLPTHPWGGPFDAHPESCVADASGHIYVGQADGTHDILKVDAAGTPLATLGPLVTDRGTDWIDLAADQCTMFYAGEGFTIRRYDVCTNMQLADFATAPASPCYALRIRANGEVLVACSSEIVRFSPTGTVLQTYPLPSDATGFFFALNLDPDGTSFWSADFYTGNVYRFDIGTGAILTEFNAGPTVDLAGLAIFGEPQVGGGGGGGGAGKCPLSQGFWKTHPGAWPVTSLTLGSQTYTQAELLAILNTPTGGSGGADASVILADQLIAAKLNIANGSDATPISSTIADADALLSGFAGKLPYHVKPSSAIGQQMVGDASTLEGYNTDQLTPGCTQ
jgi:hypothetical protein